MVYGAGRREKAYLAERSCCRITGEWAADETVTGVTVGSGMVGYEVALVLELISALLHWSARSSGPGQFRSLDAPAKIVNNCRSQTRRCAVNSFWDAYRATVDSASRRVG